MTEPLDIEVRGESANFQVNVTFARDEVTSVAISRSLIDPQKQADLERSVREAVNAALEKYTVELGRALERLPRSGPDAAEIQRLQAAVDEVLDRGYLA